MGVRLTTDSPATARLFAKLLKSYFDTKADLNVEDTTPLKKGHAYQLIITPDMNADLILRETGILGVKEGSNYITDGIPADLIRKKCCKKACGYIFRCFFFISIRQGFRNHGSRTLSKHKCYRLDNRL